MRVESFLRLTVLRAVPGRLWVLGACLAVLVLPRLDGHADDWPQWGGPNRDLVWREDGIVEKLPVIQGTGTPPRMPRVWSTRIGEGYSGPAVSGGRVYVTDLINRRGFRGIERVLCLDAETGAPVWQHLYPVNYSGLGYPAGPRSTPLIDSGRVYTIGAMGQTHCFDANTGDVLWKKDFIGDYGTRVPQWGMVAAPLLDGRQLITLVGGRDGALVVSFDKTTGNELWRALDDEEPGYCPPMMFTFGGTRQVIVWHPSAVTSLNPANGEVYWEIPFRVRSGLCIPTPRKIGNRLFITCFYNGSLMIEVSPDGKHADVAWKRRGRSERQTEALHAIICTPYINEGYIYGVGSYGQLRCLSAENGDRMWETFEATGEGRWWNAFLIRYEPRDDFYFIHNEQGDLITARLTPDGYHEISRGKLLDATRSLGRQGRKVVWSHPAFADKSIFARNDEEIVRVNLAAEK